MAASLSALYDDAFAALERAIALDRLEKEEKGQTRAEDRTVLQYEAAIDLFQQCYDRESDVSRKILVESKMREYGKRLATLKATVADRRWTEAKALDAGRSKAPTDDQDEAVAGAYLEAVELYLGSMKLQCNDEVQDVALRGRVNSILDRVEILKKKQRPPLSPSQQQQQQQRPRSSPSTTTTHATVPAPAFSTDFLDLPLPPTSTLPYSNPSLSTPSSLPSSRARSATDLTPAEIEVLRKSSIINGRTFLPWMEGEELREQFHYPRPFTDPEGLLPLSPKQAARLGGWRRPHEFIKGAPGTAQGPRMIRSITPHSIEQDMVPDCSFVASLCICAAFEQRFHTRLITKIIYPQDGQGVPIYNPSGKYIVKLWANGCLRKVVVDDLLPVDKQGELLCSSSSDRTELWVSIVEKAAMKLSGGSYDFPGSNSGVDMQMLTGWVPEQIFWLEDEGGSSSTSRTGGRGVGGSRSRRRSSNSSSSNTSSSSGNGRGPPVLDHRQPAERAWARLRSASELGDCLTTIATSPMNETEADRLGLVPSHAYAVLSVREVLGGQRFLLVKNPWRRKSWRGPYCAADTARWTPALCQALGYDPRAAQKKDDGVGWIAWADVRKYFSSIFLNWRPGLFSHKTTHHALWPKEQGPPNDMFSYSQNPQYLLKVDKSKASSSSSSSSSVWLLLSRHVTQSRDELSESNSTISSNGSNSGGDYLTLHVYKSDVGKFHRNPARCRIIYPVNEDCFVRGLYSNNPHNLVRFDVETLDPGTYAVVLSQYEKKRDVRYSLTVLSTAPFSLQPTPVLPPTVTRMEGTWGGETAGGRLGLSTFLQNPQFTVVVKKACAVYIEMMAPKEYFVGFSLLGGSRGGKRVDSILQGEEVLTSGAYRQGFCAAATVDNDADSSNSTDESSSSSSSNNVLARGTYTLVASTYEAGLRGNFVINVHSVAGEGSIQASVLLPEGDGFICQVLTGAWEGKVAGGCSPPGYAAQNPTFLISCTERTRVFMRLMAHEKEPVNVSLFQLPPASSGGTAGASELPVLSTFPGCPTTIATSHNAIFTASRCGVTTPIADLTTGTYAVVLACYNAGVESGFTLTVFSSRSMEVRRVL